MSAGIKALRKIQIGRETVAGTAVPATARLIGTATIEKELKVNRPEDRETGKLSSFEFSSPVGVNVKVGLEGEAYFEQLLYVLGMSLKGVIAGTGGASPYTWTYEGSLLASSSVNTSTLEYGDDVQAFQVPFVFGKSLELSGTIDEAVKFKMDGAAADVTPQTFTGAILDPLTLNPIAVDTGKLFIDTTWAGLGGTNKAATLVDFTWKITEGIIPVKYLDGNLTMSDRAEKKRHVELEMTLAFNSAAYALWAMAVAVPQTKTFVRLEFTGPALVTGNNKLTLDGCYVLDQPPKLLEEREGQDTVKVKLMSIYDTTSTKEWSVAVVNGLAAMP